MSPFLDKLRAAMADKSGRPECGFTQPEHEVPFTEDEFNQSEYDAFVAENIDYWFFKMRGCVRVKRLEPGVDNLVEGMVEMTKTGTPSMEFYNLTTPELNALSEAAYKFRSLGLGCFASLSMHEIATIEIKPIPK